MAAAGYDPRAADQCSHEQMTPRTPLPPLTATSKNLRKSEQHNRSKCATFTLTATRQKSRHVARRKGLLVPVAAGYVLGAAPAVLLCIES
jgi:hypothetical protein